MAERFIVDARSDPVPHPKTGDLQGQSRKASPREAWEQKLFGWRLILVDKF